MRNLFLAAVGVFVAAGAASAQQPVYAPVQPVQYPAVAPAAGTIPSVTVPGYGPTVRGAFVMAPAGGGNCQFGNACNSGCGSVRSDFAFHFGSCKSFFDPCGPKFNGCGGMFGGRCPVTPFATPWGTGWTCPKPYDTYLNH